MENISKTHVIRIEKNAIWAKLKEAIIIIVLNDNTDEKVFKLNKTASYIWEHCDGKTSVKEIVQGVCAEFEIDENRALEDTTQFIEKMSKKNLLRVTS